VVENRDVSESVFILRLERRGLEFRPGQWINIGRAGSPHRREYTVYSPPTEDFLEVLIKEVQGGLVSGDLHGCRSGDLLSVDGPHGSFCIDPGTVGERFLLVGTGTGISPFHCLTLSHPCLDYLLLHGVRSPQQLYERKTYDLERFVACISGAGANSGETRYFAGRVTLYLRQNPVEPTRLCYLCGNSDMIYECYAILRGYGVPPSRIFAEVYF
jgi:ferredoxin--NADP+ reductase/benzoate/toluate 1,2-dioxygenase reductase subunit